MSREIKFRAKVADSDYENEKQSEMIGSFVHFTGFIGLENDTGYVEQLEEIHGVGWFDVDLKTLGQYTGLKDKRGTEIFEGDILNCKCWDKRKSSIDGFDPLGETPYFYRNSVIEWWHSHCNLGYRLRDGKGKTLMIKPSSLNAMEVEVIGNIYEHKHLLEETA